jgi:hypothetical protein
LNWLRKFKTETINAPRLRGSFFFVMLSTICFGSAINIMKRNSCYLPTLNALFLQNVHYQHHVENLSRSKSSYDHLTPPCLHQRDIKANDSSARDRQGEEKGWKYRPSPYERRRRSVVEQENARMVLALQYR